MADFNSCAENHPCMNCAFGSIWTEMGNPAGNVCKHPETMHRPGLYYGRYHSLKKIPMWCPKNDIQHHKAAQREEVQDAECRDV